MYLAKFKQLNCRGFGEYRFAFCKEGESIFKGEGQLIKRGSSRYGNIPRYVTKTCEFCNKYDIPFELAWNVMHVAEMNSHSKRPLEELANDLLKEFKIKNIIKE